MIKEVAILAGLLLCCAALPAEITPLRPTSVILLQPQVVHAETLKNAEILQPVQSGWKNSKNSESLQPAETTYGGRYGHGGGWKNGYGNVRQGYGPYRPGYGYGGGWKRGGYKLG